MYRTLLVPLDGSALGEGALPTAATLAQRMGARVVLVRVVDDASPSTVHTAQHYLESVRARLPSGVPVETHVSHGPAATGILDAIFNSRADLVIMTTHGRGGLRRLVYGSVAAKVLVASPAPVWLVPVRGTPYPPLLSKSSAQVLAVLDGSLFAEAALAHTTALARVLGGSVLLLRVVPPQPLLVDPMIAETLSPEADDEQAAEVYLRNVASTLTHEGISVHTVFRTGSPAQAILDEIWSSGADVLVIATHGRSGIDRTLLGSVAQAVIHACAIPMLVVRPHHSNGGEN